jgi:K+-sensing histidine kinase KdpD
LDHHKIKELKLEKEKKVQAAKQIQEKSLEIENFVKEIIKTSSEDILEIEVKNSEFYLKDLINKVIANYKEKCSLKMIDFIVEDYTNKLVKGDLERALEVIGNIIENAFKYGDGKVIKISFYEEDYFQLIKIFNSGETISQNEFNHIFESFYRASNAKDKPGNGLGLYICKAIMEKMDGEVFPECEREGMGFTLVFR